MAGRTDRSAEPCVGLLGLVVPLVGARGIVCQRVGSTLTAMKGVYSMTEKLPESQRPIVLAILCPHCGQPYTRPFPAPFDEQFSTLVDWLLAIEDAARQARHAVEEVML